MNILATKLKKIWELLLSLQLIYILFRQIDKRNKFNDIKVKGDFNMKQFLIAIAMVLTLSMNANATAQKHRHTPRTEQVDSTKNNQDAIEAFSDTTATAANADDAEDDEYISRHHRSSFEFSGWDGFDGKDLVGIIFVLSVVAIIFLIAPIAIIIAIFYFVNKNRREKYKLAQMAMQNGQPIPDQLLKENAASAMVNKDDYNTGLRQMFTGIGLAIFLGIIIGKLGIGIGALIFFIGLGKWFVARQAKNDAPMDNNNYDNFNSHNNGQETDTL